MPLVLAIENLFRNHGLTPTSEEAARPARNLLDGRRDTFWVATSAVEQTLMVDAGLGNTLTVDYVALTHAERLAAVAAAVHVEWSVDAATNWTTVGAPFPLTPIQTSHLLSPESQDYYTSVASTTKRAWRIRLAGTLTGSPSLAGAALGVKTAVPDIKPGSSYSKARSHRGGDLVLEWPKLSETDMETLLTALAAVSPEYPSEAPATTLAGGVWGGRSHYIYESLGYLHRQAGLATPALFHVVLMTPMLTPEIQHNRTTARSWTLPPVSWAELVG